MEKEITLPEICKSIKDNWIPVHPTAKPYFAAMQMLESIDESFGSDSGKSIVRYFLANAQSWRGEVARTVKSQLNKMVK